MTLKNPTEWQAPSGTGYFAPSSGAALTTLSGSTLTTLSLVSLTIDTEVYSPKFPASWALTGKNDSQWIPNGGEGYVIDAGALNIVTNSGLFLTDNLGNAIVTTPTYDVPKYPSLWAEAGV